MFAEKVIKETPVDEQFAPRQKVYMIVVESIDNGFNVKRHFSTFCNRQYSAVFSDHGPVKDQPP
jgi:hypothetical protein